MQSRNFLGSESAVTPGTPPCLAGTSFGGVTGATFGGVTGATEPDVLRQSQHDVAYCIKTVTPKCSYTISYKHLGS